MEINHEHRLTAVEEISKSNQRRIDDLEKRQGNLEDLTSTVRVLATREENVENTVEEIKMDVKSLTNKPAQRWEGIVDKVIFTVVGAVVMYVLTKFGL